MLSAIVLIALLDMLGATITPLSVQADPVLPDRGLAPELTNTTWLNSPQPLRLAELRGQVVLLDFWTIDCYNCEHTIPYLRDIYKRLSGKGLQIISIHYPEFGYERDLSTVQAYAKQWDIRYPIAIDNDAATWSAYEMHAWPAFEIVDKNGHRRFRSIGEGGYQAIDAAIQALLAESYSGPLIESF